MDLKNIPSSYHPAYAWLWNSTITKEGIRAQIEEMYEAGIRAFYMCAEHGTNLAGASPATGIYRQV